MKWKTKLYASGDERVVTKFLFLPKRIGEDVRWLERVKIRQQSYKGLGDWGLPQLEWEDLEFVDEHLECRKCGAPRKVIRG